MINQSKLEDLLDAAPKSEKEYLLSIKKIFKVRDLDSLDGAVIFGTENLGKKISNELKKRGLAVKCFSDNNSSKWERAFEGSKIIDPSKIPINSKVVIASKHVKEIYGQLAQLGIKNIIPHYVLSVLFPKVLENPFYQNNFESIANNRKNTTEAFDLLTDSYSKALFLKLLRFRISLSPFDLPDAKEEQYYPRNIWKIEKNETYIDVGAFTGDTLKQFLAHSKGKFNKYYAIEPDDLNFAELLKNIPKTFEAKIIPVKAAIGAETGIATFSGTGRDDSKLSKTGKIKVKVISLDKYLHNETATTLKIDVEGYEPEVLLGSKNIIKSNKPKIAISAYHRPWHLWDLILQINRYNQNYRFYLRHHEPEIYGTILYAT